MTPETFLDHLLRRGSTVSVVGEKIRVEAPYGVLTPDIRAALATHKPALRRLLMFADQYRDALLGTGRVDARLIDELGPELATAIREVVQASTVSDIV
jgi:hypothetical protein